MKFLNPMAKQDVSIIQPAPRLTSLDGIRIGLLDNGKANVYYFFVKIEQLFRDKVKTVEFFKVRKRQSSSGAEKELIEDLARKCNIVITAFAD